MRSLVRPLACTVLALVAGMVSVVSAADERSVRSAQWAEAAARQAQEAQRRQREVRLRWAYERRRSAAHARMPNTLYASTPSNQARAELACPVLVDDDTRRLSRNALTGQGPSSRVLRAPDLFRSGSSSKRSWSSGVRVFAAQGPGTANSFPWSSKSIPNHGAATHKDQVSGWAAASIRPKSATGRTHYVNLVPSDSEPLREGFVRVINHSAQAGEVSIDPVDDGGRAFDTITLSIDANETVHFNSGDLEMGNEGKGLTGSTGSGEGDWRLAVTSDLDIEVLAYIRTTDGFLTAMHDVAPADGDIRRIAIFNPGSNRNQVSRLRLINPTEAMAEVTIRGTDDKGVPGSGEVSLSLEAGTAREITAEQLETGATGLAGMLGDGSGKWRLEVESEQSVVAMSLLESPTDHLTNLSTVPTDPEDGVYSAPLFPAAGDTSGRQGFVRVINATDSDGEIIIKAYDETERDYETLTLTIGANEVVHFNSDDLEQGSTGKGLSGSTGAGNGDWRLELTSDLEIEVLSYIRTGDGFLTAMHDVVPSTGNRHRVAVFNPGSNRNQESLLRLINPADVTAEVTITGIDGNGAPGQGDVTLDVPAGGSRTVGAWDLESGAENLDGALGDGVGKWQLLIESDRPVVAMSLLRSPTGHMTNLSTAPVRGAKGATVQEPETAEAVFRQLISGPIVQTKCINCHVGGGASGNTRLVFVTDENPDHAAINLQVFRDFLDDEEDGAGYILNKIQGALGHGGGIQVAAGTEDYANMERLLSLLGADVGSVAITPNTLFDGVKMESRRSTLRRASIIFAGRTPTNEEYESIETAERATFRAAIRNLMQGPEFHEFLIRASNDRLLTDRDDIQGVGVIDPIFGYFVDYNNLNHEKLVAEDPNHGEWRGNVDYGIRRAPLELVAYVVENDRPYTEILTADYIMANAMAAEAYGDETALFHDPDDLHEFQPSEIASYYRNDNSKEFEYTFQFGAHVSDPGNLITDYPHAGILNTTVFLKRYPTTATNRNRARSRWTYYHFLGLDVEKSASRTTDPVALADRDNPTMNNQACTVCHEVLDPVAGAFQNYDDVGYYRSGWGGFDSLDEQYKEHPEGTDHEIHAPSNSSREAADIVTASSRLVSGAQEISLRTVNDGEGGSNIHVDYLTIRDESGAEVEHYELEELADENSDRAWDGRSFEICCEPLVVPVEIPSDGTYMVEVGAWLGYQWGDGVDRPGTLRISMGNLFYRNGDTWYRDMREPGFNGDLAPYSDNSLQWLAQQIVADPRFAEATVKFWWPAIMGSEVAEPPEQGDADFESRLLASNAQSAELQRLARGFQRGFGTGESYNLKDLLTEIVLSRWFRASSMTDDDPVRATALERAGAKRLLTPEELSRKTLAITGFGWERRRPSYPWWGGAIEHRDWTARDAYGLLYGGIDSGGIAERARDITPIMGGVAKRHGGAVACPVVMKDFYLLEDGERILFNGVDRNVSPAFEFGKVFDVEATSGEDRETLSIQGHLKEGPAKVVVSLTNEIWDGEAGTHTRRLYLDRMVIRDDNGSAVQTREFEDLDHYCVYGAGDAIVFWDACPVGVPFDVPVAGSYEIEITAWAEHEGGAARGEDDQFAKLEVVVEGDPDVTAGAAAIKTKLIDLFEKLLGVSADVNGIEIAATYELFVKIWQGNRDSFVSGFDIRCDWESDQYYLDGIVEGAWVDPEAGEEWDWDRHGWDRERFETHFENIDWSDRHHIARTWVAMLAFMLTDYRYLFL